MNAWRAWGLMFVAAVGVVGWQPPREPTPAPRPQVCMWRWAAPDGRTVYTVAPDNDQWEARPGYWEWGLWTGWTWQKAWEFEAMEKIPLKELWRRAHAQAITPPKKPDVLERVKGLNKK